MENRLPKRHGAILFGIGCIGLGVVLDQILRQGFAPLLLSLAVLFAKAVFSYVGKTFFQHEIDAVKAFLFVGDDPVKQTIWRVHRRQRHRLDFRRCQHPDCAPYD